MPAGVSRYLDIAADLRTRILNGEWTPGSNLPRMMDLARQYGVNRDTLARAIAILEAEGLLSAVPRKGTIVRRASSRPRMMARDWAAVAQAMKSRLAELDMTQAELIQRSRLAPMTIRELLFNTAQRRRSNQTLAAASEALGWPSSHLLAVAEGRGPDDPYTADPVLPDVTTGGGRRYPDNLPRHSVSAGAAVIRGDGRMLAIKRADNGEWVLPGGIVELDEDPRDTVRREVLEETRVIVEPGRLTGVYKNMRLGVVSLVFRCRPVSGAAQPTAEATEVAWLDSAQITGRMTEAFAIRLTDALEAGEPRIRIHDGQQLLG